MKMNSKYRKVPTEFGPETRFEGLKSRLVAELLEGFPNAGRTASVRRAANEAAALAWTTPYPLLVFPVLFEEKLEAGLLMAARQAQVLERSRELLAL